MYNEEKLYKVKNIIMTSSLILMILTVILQVFAYNVITHIILCGLVISLLLVEIIISKFMGTFKWDRIFLCVLWLVNLAINLLQFF